MEYREAIHEAGHAVAATFLGLSWSLLDGDDEYVAKVRVYKVKDEDDATFIKLCGPYAETGIGEIISEDYHWDHIKDAPQMIKEYHEEKADDFVLDHWKEIVDLAEQFMAGTNKGVSMD